MGHDFEKSTGRHKSHHQTIKTIISIISLLVERKLFKLDNDKVITNENKN